MSDPAVLDAGNPLASAFTEAVGAELEEFLAGQQAVLAPMGPELVPVHRLAARLLRGGKRVRPAFCVWGYVAAAGLPDAATFAALLPAAASLDVLHVSALIHDDVMDASDLRRGEPSAHRQFEALHARSGWRGDAGGFGRAAAIVVGDLLVMWSAQLLEGAGLDPVTLARARPVVEAMRTEVTCGQYLDVVAQARPLPEGSGAPGTGATAALDEAARVVEYKSARYTVQRPAQFGAALGGGSPELHDALAAFGSPIGRAFQFRDDLLGVFGDTAVTGKPTGDDLREGKRTVLIAHALAHAGPAGARQLAQRLGDPALDAAGVAELQDVLTGSGARDAVEAMIEEGYDRALTALAAAELTEVGRAGLTALADAAVRREF